MIERVKITDLKDGYVKIELADETGIVIDVSVVPENEWRDLRNNVLKTIPNNDFSLCVTYLAAFTVLLEDH
jgi:hypothetical protein